MDQHNISSGTISAAFWVIIILCMFFIFVSTFGDEVIQKSLYGDHHNEHQEEEEAAEAKDVKKPSTLEMLKSTFSLYTSASPLSSSNSSYRDKLKTFLNQAQAYFFPPNLDFRGSNNEAEAIINPSGGQKVKKPSQKLWSGAKKLWKSLLKLQGKQCRKRRRKLRRLFLIMSSD